MTGLNIRDYQCQFNIGDRDSDFPEIQGFLSAISRADNDLTPEPGFSFEEALIDIKKDRPSIKEAYQIYSDRLITKLRGLIKEYGITAISYGDPTAGVSILGPKILSAYTEGFTLPLLRRIRSEFPDLQVIICPKASFALIDLGLAEEVNHEIEPGLNYEEAIGRYSHIKTIGQLCIKKRDSLLKNNCLKEIILKKSE